MKKRDWVIVAALLAFTAVVFAPVLDASFVRFDDNVYVYENPRVLGGPTAGNIFWALTQFHASNWHPLTWISHMVDARLFGSWAGGHHAVNLLFHLANVALLFLLLSRLTGAMIPSAAAAALFAVHPLHVESVAWIAERKDLLSTCFWLLAALAWLRHLRRPGPWPLAATLLLYAAALSSKAMPVTFPAVLLLFDWWPLGRLGGQGERSRPLGKLLLEKLPFFLLAAVSSAITVLAQQSSASVVSMERIPLGQRALNAALSAAVYLQQMLWPAGLQFYYPHSKGALPLVAVAAATLLLAGITIGAILAARRRPYVATGWFFYLGTLVPVSGLVQVGLMSRADRYTYLPLTGIFIIAAWGGREFLRRRPALRGAAVVLTATVLLLLGGATLLQSAHWRNDTALFTHTLEINPDNWFAHKLLSDTLLDAGREEEALRHYGEVIRLVPNMAHRDMDPARILAQLRESGQVPPAGTQDGAGRGPQDPAIERLREELRANPRSLEANNGLGAALAAAGRLEEALAVFREGERSLPRVAGLRFNSGIVLSRLGRLEEAASAYRGALEVDPRFAPAHNNLGMTLEALGRKREALEHYREAVRVAPGDAGARANLERLEYEVRGSE